MSKLWVWRWQNQTALWQAWQCTVSSLGKVRQHIREEFLKNLMDFPYFNNKDPKRKLRFFYMLFMNLTACLIKDPISWTESFEQKLYRMSDTSNVIFDQFSITWNFNLVLIENLTFWWGPVSVKTLNLMIFSKLSVF